MNKTDILRDQVSRQLRVNDSNNFFHSDWKSSFVWLEDTLNFKKDIQAFGEDEISDLVDDT